MLSFYVCLLYGNDYFAPATPPVSFFINCYFRISIFFSMFFIFFWQFWSTFWTVLNCDWNGTTGPWKHRASWSFIEKLGELLCDSYILLIKLSTILDMRWLWILGGFFAFAKIGSILTVFTLCRFVVPPIFYIFACTSLCASRFACLPNYSTLTSLLAILFFTKSHDSRMPLSSVSANSRSFLSISLISS